jgi:hypothetical protein
MYVWRRGCDLLHDGKICYLLKNILVTSSIYEFLSNFLGVI